MNPINLSHIIYEMGLSEAVAEVNPIVAVPTVRHFVELAEVFDICPGELLFNVAHNILGSLKSTFSFATYGNYIINKDNAYHIIRIIINNDEEYLASFTSSEKQLSMLTQIYLNFFYFLTATKMASVKKHETFMTKGSPSMWDPETREFYRGRIPPDCKKQFIVALTSITDPYTFHKILDIPIKDILLYIEGANRDSKWEADISSYQARYRRYG